MASQAGLYEGPRLLQVAGARGHAAQPGRRPTYPIAVIELLKAFPGGLEMGARLGQAALPIVYLTQPNMCRGRLARQSGSHLNGDCFFAGLVVAALGN